jgi:1-Cys peroxiredoxin 6
MLICSMGHGCRSVFIIGPDKKLKLSVNYPASVGRNMDEIVRCVDALQLSADKWVPAALLC